VFDIGRDAVATGVAVNEVAGADRAADVAWRPKCLDIQFSIEA
jgi:hypothetical protein